MKYLELGTQIRENWTVTDYGRASSHLTVIFSGSQEEGWSEVVTAVNMEKTVWAKVIAQHTKFIYSLHIVTLFISGSISIQRQSI